MPPRFSGFYSKASKPGGAAREQAVQAAAEAIKDLTPMLEAETEKALTAVLAHLHGLVLPGEQPMDHLREMIPAAVALRDTAAVVHRPLLAEVAMHLCDVLDGVADGGPGLAGREVLSFAEALHAANSEPDQSFEPGRTAGLVQAVEAITSARLSEGA
jgi:hypothetical protein